jgi:hypothetical protein
MAYYPSIRKGMKKKIAAKKPVKKAAKGAMKAKREAAPREEKSAMLEERLADKEL